MICHLFNYPLGFLVVPQGFLKMLRCLGWGFPKLCLFFPQVWHPAKRDMNRLAHALNGNTSMAMAVPAIWDKMHACKWYDDDGFMILGVSFLVPSSLLLGSPGASWGLLGAPVASWGLLWPPGASWGLLGPPGASWGLLGPPGPFEGCSGLPLAFPK